MIPHKSENTTLTTLQEQVDEANRLFQTNRFEDSERIFRTLLAQHPLIPDLLNSLATVLDAQHQYREATAYYFKALALKPEFPIARYNLAKTLQRSGDLSGCKEQLQLAAEIDPDFVQAWQNLASIHFTEGNLEESTRCLEKIIQIEPEEVIAWVESKEFSHLNEDIDSNLKSCLENLTLHPTDFAACYNSRGLVLHELGDYPRAEVNYRAALALAPDDPYIMSNLGFSLTALGRLDEAIKWFNQSIVIENSPTTRYNRGAALLAKGDYKQGWDDYEFRFEKNDPVYLAPISIPRWNGEALNGKRIIVRMEQGYGDCIQCLRFLPTLQESGAIVFVEALDDRIRSLVPMLDREYKTFLRGEPTPEADFQIPVFSLPHILGTTLSSIPFASGYLRVDAPLAEFWNGQIVQRAKSGDMKIGVVWGGRKTRLNSNRSLQLDDLSPLLSLPGISWFSLQVGNDADQLPSYKPMITDLGEGFITFADTAAAVSNLDLVITIDTSVAHLAGSIGVPSWVMLKYAPDWRWLLDRDDSPWYQSITLFRQAIPGDWTDVVQAIKTALRKKQK